MSAGRLLYQSYAGKPRKNPQERAKVTHNIHSCLCAAHTAVKINSLSVTLNNVTILDNITASVPRGVCTAIVGPNGAGKSTLAKALLNEIPHSGTVMFGNSSNVYTTKQPRWGYVPQKIQFDRNMPLTVMEFLASSLTLRPLFCGISPKLKTKIGEMLETVECPYLANRQLGKLSGGELQRVLLASALLQKPEILLLDEPAAGVDFQGEKLCCGLLEKFRRKYQFTQIMISHDLATVAAHAAHVICINHKLVAAGHPADVLTQENLQAAFGQHTAMIKPIEHSEVCTCSKNA